MTATDALALGTGADATAEGAVEAAGSTTETVADGGGADVDDGSAWAVVVGCVEPQPTRRERENPSPSDRANDIERGA